MQRLPEAHVLQDAVEQDEHRRQHPEHDDEHLLDVGPGDRLYAANRRVDDHRDTDRKHGDGQRPSEHRRHHDRWSRQGDPKRRRAADEEQKARERSRLRVEAALEVFVGGVDARACEERDHRQRQDDHRERQAEIELHEAKAREIPEPRGADDGDGAHLRRHHRQADRPPRQRPVREQVAVDFVGRLRSP